MDEKITIYIYSKDVPPEMMSSFSEVFYNMKKYERIYDVMIVYNKEANGLEVTGDSYSVKNFYKVLTGEEYVLTGDITNKNKKIKSVSIVSFAPFVYENVSKIDSYQWKS